MKSMNSKFFIVASLLLTGLTSQADDLDDLYTKECRNKEVFGVDTCKALYRIIRCTTDCKFTSQILDSCIQQLNGNGRFDIDECGAVKDITLHTHIYSNSDSEVRNYFDRCIDTWAQKHREIIISKQVERNDSADTYSINLRLLKPKHVDNEGNAIGISRTKSFSWISSRFE